LTRCLILGVGFGVNYLIAKIGCLRVVAMATYLGMQFGITGFVWTIATKRLLMEGGLSGRTTECIYCRYLHLWEVAMATTFCLSIHGVHIRATWRIWLNRPCVAAMWPYVKLLWPLVVIRPHRSTTCVDAACCYRWSSVVCRSVSHDCEPSKNCWTDWDVVWDLDLGGPRNHVLDGSPDPQGEGAILREGRGSPL